MPNPKQWVQEGAASANVSDLDQIIVGATFLGIRFLLFSHGRGPVSCIHARQRQELVNEVPSGAPAQAGGAAARLRGTWPFYQWDKAAAGRRRRGK
jgi:hypothetical protein